jgi:hypothetical protein
VSSEAGFVTGQTFAIDGGVARKIYVQPRRRRMTMQPRTRQSARALAFFTRSGLSDCALALVSLSSDM